MYLSLGRKTRFSTLRESYSGALGRFIPNPALKAESAYSGEIGITSIFNLGTADLSFFLSYLNDGIVRKSLEGGQFQRINEDVIRTFGIEASANLNLIKNLHASLHFTYLNSSAKDEAGNFTDTLEYKPSIISSLNLLYTIIDGFESFLELHYTGIEFGLQEGNPYFQKLPDYLITNFRLSYSFKASEYLKFEIYGRVNNIFDKLYYNQWGLPEAGRQFLGGITAEF